MLAPDGDWLALTLPAGLSRAVRALARQHDVSTFMVLHAALAVVLARLSGVDDITVGTAVANRPHPETAPLVGDFINLVALRTHFDGDPTLADVLARVRETDLAAFAHQSVPFEQVVDALAPRRDPSRNALFQALLVVQPPTPS